PRRHACARSTAPALPGGQHAWVASACPRLSLVPWPPVAARGDDHRRCTARQGFWAGARPAGRSTLSAPRGERNPPLCSEASPMSSTWYESFFSPLALEFWRAVVPPEVTEAEVAFVERALGLKGSGRLLDLPCGHGRHALALARRGYQVTGV